MKSQLLIPSHYDPSLVKDVRWIKCQPLEAEAKRYAKKIGLKPAASDKTRIALMLVDCQNTFCVPGAELFVGGRSGMAAVEDNQRLCQFIYGNLDVITRIFPTMDTHIAMQIFHSIFLVNDAGENPDPMTLVTLDDVMNGVWKVNPAVADSLFEGNYVGLQKHLIHYSKRLSEGGKYPLIIWPYHAMLGGIGHALASSIEEAVHFHNFARNSQTGFQVKGLNPLSENYSIFKAEVLDTDGGQPIAQKNAEFLQNLMDYDAVVIAGQAKSHCVAWTIDDLLEEIQKQDPSLVKKVYLLDDCTSPVVVPGVIDFTDQADAAFKRFENAGMHVVKSTDPIDTWPGITL